VLALEPVPHLARQRFRQPGELEIDLAARRFHELWQARVDARRRLRVAIQRTEYRGACVLELAAQRRGHRPIGVLAQHAVGAGDEIPRGCARTRRSAPPLRAAATSR
jgi:hypothetical protein